MKNTISKHDEECSLSNFSKIEKEIIEHCSRGDEIIIGDGTRPRKKGNEFAENLKVNASFLRQIITGEILNLKLHHRGLHIKGAIISGKLDLENINSRVNIFLEDCFFTSIIDLRGGKFKTLSFSRSRIHGVKADRSNFEGTVLLNGLQSKGEVSFNGSRILGNLELDNAILFNDAGFAIDADRIFVGRYFFFRRTRTKGTVWLNGAHIIGNMEFDGAKLNGNLSEALVLYAARIETTLFLRRGFRAKGLVNLAGAVVNTLSDDENSWPNKGDIDINNFKYNYLGGKSPRTAEARLRWINLQFPRKDGIKIFNQPYTQCASVLTRAGYEDEAKSILVKQNIALRKAGKISFLILPFHVLYGTLAAYGYRPMRTVIFSVIIIAISTSYYSYLYENGVIVPNNAFVLRSPEWVECIERKPFVSATHCWITKPQGQSYQKFNALAYSIDTFLPIFNLHQEPNWILSAPTKSSWKIKYSRVWLWLHISLGWMMTAFFVSGVTGLIKNKTD